MAKELNVITGITGQTWQAQLYLNAVPTGSLINIPEVVGAGGKYSGDMAGGAGHYTVSFFLNGALTQAGEIVWDGSKEITLLELPTVAQIVSGIFAAVIENGKTFAQIIRINFAVLKGRTTGAGTLSNTFLSDDGTKSRVSTTFDASKNRTSVTVDGN